MLLGTVQDPVSEATEIEATAILSKSRKEEHVEARAIAIYCCIKKGLKPVQVAELMQQTSHNIYRSLNCAKDRYQYSSSFRFDCDLVCKELGLICDLGCKYRLIVDITPEDLCITVNIDRNNLITSLWKVII